MQDDDESHARKFEPPKGRNGADAGSAKAKSKRRKIDCCGNPEIADRRIDHRRGGHRSTSRTPVGEDDKLGG